MEIAVLGDGAVALATAADLTLGGHAVRLWQSDAGAGSGLREAGAVTVSGGGRPGSARLSRVTTDIADAVDGADVVIAPGPAAAHDDLAGRLAGHLHERQLVVLAPGTFGGYVLARALTRAGVRLPYAIVETATLPYRVRGGGPAAVQITAAVGDLPVGVFPAARAAAALERLTGVYGSLRRCVDVLDAALLNPGPVLHPPLALLTAGADGSRLDPAAAAASAGVRRLVEAVDAERIATRRGLGYPAPHERPAAGGDDRPSVDEEVALGLALLESAARTAGAESSATSGLLLVFGALAQRPLSGRGRALDHLGLGDLVRREIRELLVEGWASPLWRRVVR